MHSKKLIYVTLLKTVKQCKAHDSSPILLMAFPQVIAAFLALLDVIGLPGNLIVLLTIILDSRFHVMRYILLASLALSDFLMLILVNSFLIESMAQENWLFGQTMCNLNSSFARYFYINTILHLVAVSYDRYLAIVKSPLTYDGIVTKMRVVFLALIWIIPVIPVSVGPFLGNLKYVYNPKVFFCEQQWAVQTGSSTNMIVSFIAILLPLLIIIFLNVSVYKTARRQIEAMIEVQVGGPVSDTESPQQQEIASRRLRDRKAAVDVAIIVTAFFLCFLPGSIRGVCSQFVPEIDFPPEVVFVTMCIFFFNTICNPIIYSIRKREFRNAVRKMFRMVGGCPDLNGNDSV